MPTEHVIRDVLASDLAALEEGLTPVKTEYPLPNAQGTRGFIDILARDRFRNFVVIELKRSNDTASRALHELFKYAELLAREKGLDRSAVRCILVSTVWDELRVPFSLLKRTFPYDTIGFLINVDDSGAITAVQSVEPVEEADPHGVTPVHHFFLFSNSETRDAAWPEVSGILSSVGSPDHVALALDRQLAFEETLHALYLVVGRTPPTDSLRHLDEDVPDDSIEAPEGFVWEYRALCELTSRYRGADGAEIGYPDKLRYVLSEDGRWEVSKVFRAGRFVSQSDLVADDELIEAIGGFSGASSVALAVRSSPERSGHWKETREKIRRCLFGNPNWESITAAWLDEVESEAPRAEIAFAVFNPCDVIGSVINTLTGDQATNSIPHLECQLIIGSDVVRNVLGTLVYRPREGNVDIERAFEEVYDDVIRWGVARNFGETWLLDIDLCERTGLEYACFEFVADDEGTYKLTVSERALERVRAEVDLAKSTDLRPLRDWLKANDEGLTAITTMMAAHTRGLFPGLDAYE